MSYIRASYTTSLLLCAARLTPATDTSLSLFYLSTLSLSICLYLSQSINQSISHTHTLSLSPFPVRQGSSELTTRTLGQRSGRASCTLPLEYVSQLRSNLYSISMYSLTHQSPPPPLSDSTHKLSLLILSLFVLSESL